MVLAIGIVVDDAIVVLENVERIMREDKLPPREAAIKAMREVTGPIIAIVLTLTAVFVPIAFLGGLTGELYRQFAVTISISVVISGLVALTLSPALCVLILKRGTSRPSRFFAWFNRWFARVTHRYTDGVVVDDPARRRSASCCSSAWSRSPRGCGASRRASLVPDEDQGFYIARGDPARRRDARAHRQGREAGRGGDPQRTRRTRTSIAFTGFDFIGGGFRNNAATIFVTQMHVGRAQGDRARSSSASSSARPRASRKRWCSRSTRRRSSASAPRAASSSTSRTAAKAAPKRLHEVTQAFLARANQDPKLGGAQTLWRATVPQLYVDVDREKAKKLGVPIDDVFNALVGDARHLLRQRLQQVRPHLAGADVRRAAATASGPTTSAASTCARDNGEMVPLSSLATVQLHRRAPTRSTASTTCRRSRSSARRAPGIQLGPGDRARRADRARSAAGRLQLRLGRHVVPGEALGRRVDVRARRWP